MENISSGFSGPEARTLKSDFSIPHFDVSSQPHLPDLMYKCISSSVSLCQEIFFSMLFWCSVLTTEISVILSGILVQIVVITWYNSYLISSVIQRRISNFCICITCAIFIFSNVPRTKNNLKNWIKKSLTNPFWTRVLQFFFTFFSSKQCLKKWFSWFIRRCFQFNSHLFHKTFPQYYRLKHEYIKDRKRIKYWRAARGGKAQNKPRSL